MRKHILGNRGTATVAADFREIRVKEVATVFISSEAPDHPAEHIFDESRGEGGSRWVAGEPGEQVLIVAFDSPQTLGEIALEVEEVETARTQEVELAVSGDGGYTYEVLRRQEYTFSPPGTTFEREQWVVQTGPVTHVRLRILPDKSRRPCLATLTSLVLRSAIASS